MSTKRIWINPEVGFGRPCLHGTGIPTDNIADRFIAGDSIAVLAFDYHRPLADIEAALRFELATPAVRRELCEIVATETVTADGQCLVLNEKLDTLSFLWRPVKAEKETP